MEIVKSHHNVDKTITESNLNSGLKKEIMIYSQDIFRLIGRIIDDRYRLIKLIGEGGMGIVFEAFDEIEDHTVAIKLLSAESLTDDIAKKRFLREAKMGIALNHPNIVKTYHFGEFDQDTIFMVMEYVNGGSLRDYINLNAPIDPIKALPIVEQLCNALNFAHQKGVLHRDLKPANILFAKNIGGNLEVRLADFGIAKLLSPNEDITSGTALTETGVILGTINYIAPEYLLGLDLSPVSDIYSLGVIIYEMLTGNCPIEGFSKEQLLYNKVYKDIEIPSKIYNFLSPVFDPLLQRVLNRNHLKRYQSTPDLLLAFKEAIAKKTIDNQG